MSKIAPQVLKQAILNILEGSKKKKRNFVETIELQFTLKNYDPNKDPRFNKTVVVPYKIRHNSKICMIADAKHADECTELGITFVTMDYLKTFNKEKRPVKKFGMKYNVFLASKNLARLIPRTIGPGLHKLDKVPIPIDHNSKLASKVDEAKRTIRFRLKKTVNINVPIGSVDLEPEQIIQNVNVAKANYFNKTNSNKRKMTNEPLNSLLRTKKPPLSSSDENFLKLFPNKAEKILQKETTETKRCVLIRQILPSLSEKAFQYSTKKEKENFRKLFLKLWNFSINRLKSVEHRNLSLYCSLIISIMKRDEFDLYSDCKLKTKSKKIVDYNEIPKGKNNLEFVTFYRENMIVTQNWVENKLTDRFLLSSEKGTIRQFCANVLSISVYRMFGVSNNITETIWGKKEKRILSKNECLKKVEGWLTNYGETWIIALLGQNNPKFYHQDKVHKKPSSSQFNKEQYFQNALKKKKKNKQTKENLLSNEPKIEEKENAKETKKEKKKEEEREKKKVKEKEKKTEKEKSIFLDLPLRNETSNEKVKKKKSLIHKKPPRHIDKKALLNKFYPKLTQPYLFSEKFIQESQQLIEKNKNSNNLKKYYSTNNIKMKKNNYTSLKTDNGLQNKSNTIENLKIDFNQSRTKSMKSMLSNKKSWKKGITISRTFSAQQMVNRIENKNHSVFTLLKDPIFLSDFIKSLSNLILPMLDEKHHIFKFPLFVNSLKSFIVTIFNIKKGNKEVDQEFKNLLSQISLNKICINLFLRTILSITNFHDMQSVKRTIEYLEALVNSYSAQRTLPNFLDLNLIEYTLQELFFSEHHYHNLFALSFTYNINIYERFPQPLYQKVLYQWLLGKRFFHFFLSPFKSVRQFMSQFIIFRMFHFNTSNQFFVRENKLHLKILTHYLKQCEKVCDQELVPSIIPNLKKFATYQSKKIKHEIQKEKLTSNQYSKNHNKLNSKPTFSLQTLNESQMSKLKPYIKYSYQEIRDSLKKYNDFYKNYRLDRSIPIPTLSFEIFCPEKNENVKREI
ncbi:60S ribosomal protein L10A [Anaeramoeba flamelloides]|uniref:60S ribosomal protein L10A n=1 Tax=Anaeramoeba flamelloides TaxID=1746091 RepID=A0AAV7YTJ3_9EUKA|nr:60S ribosomal protein L10A [Anaeramoeba flamelloides]